MANTKRYQHGSKTYDVCERHQPDPTQGEDIGDVFDDMFNCPDCTVVDQLQEDADEAVGSL